MRSEPWVFFCSAFPSLYNGGQKEGATWVPVYKGGMYVLCISGKILSSLEGVSNGSYEADSIPMCYCASVFT